ncbi:MAG: hypothetical protein HJJLKODD_01617 [Phycisphaerae bacterium]|nr:hypothetical protein [Phycisphaerae bacterium]
MRFMVSGSMIHLPQLPRQRFSCHSCTYCCREPILHLIPADRRRIDQQDWVKRLPAAPYVRLGQHWVLNQLPGQGCIFLQADGRCRIHAEYGAAEKPLGCQLFPFVLWPAESGWRVGLRYDCPTVTLSRGAELSAHASDLRRLAEQLPALRNTRPIRLANGRIASELEQQALIQQVDRWLANELRSPDERVRGFILLVQLLSDAKYDRLEDERFVELLEILIAALPEELAVAPAIAPVTRRMEVLLRQQLFAHLEALRFAEARRGWVGKLSRMLSQFRRGRQFTRLGIDEFTESSATHGATGFSPREAEIPQLVPGHPTISFRALYRIQQADQDRAEIGELLIRYLRAQLLSHAFYGPAYYDWPMITGLQALAARLKVWGWLARYLAAADQQSEIHLTHAQRAIQYIARAAGISPALGSRTERWRLEYFRLHQAGAMLWNRYHLL